jgi:hypothetical protein
MKTTTTIKIKIKAILQNQRQAWKKNENERKNEIEKEKRNNANFLSDMTNERKIFCQTSISVTFSDRENENFFRVTTKYIKVNKL